MNDIEFIDRVIIINDNGKGYPEDKSVPLNEVCQEYLQGRKQFTRPELTETEEIQAKMDAAKLGRKYGMGKLPLMLALLFIENVRLVKEINEHRAARGIDPLPTFEV